MRARPRGSSPLARGLRVVRRVGGDRVGIIPARAGFTNSPTTPTPWRRDHPRSRGVYGWWIIRGVAGEGSSPLARGLLVLLLRQGVVQGIIPARAGFTTTPARRRTWARDHPRSRGVYSGDGHQRVSSQGSSPLARGLRRRVPGVGALRGIIPARAGFTVAGAGRDRHPRDHPRSRGVYYRSSPVTGPAPGSSPLARGLRRRRRGHHVRPRIIPARAGFTSVGGVGFVDVGGSSPLARGLQKRSEECTEYRRIIPARAGFTRLSSESSAEFSDHPRSRGVYTCGSLVSQRTRSLPDPRRLHCRPRARSAGSP